MIVITGNSHVNALRLGAVQLGAEVSKMADREVRIGMLGNGKFTHRQFFRECDAGAVIVQPEYVEALTALTGADVMGQPGVTYGICLGFHSPPVFRQPMWQVSALSEHLAGARTRPISSAVLDAMVVHNNRYMYSFFDALSRAGVDFFVISAPPPRRDHPCLVKTPLSTVIAVDAAFRSSVARHLQSKDIQYVMPPSETYDDDGFLLDKLAMRAPRDVHHGNADYGCLMLRKVLGFAASRRSASSAAAALQGMS